MKKIICLVLSVLICVYFTGCGVKNNKYRIAMITDGGNIDDAAYNQYIFEGMEEFGKSLDMSNTIKFYKPDSTSYDGLVSAVDKAVSGGAEVIILYRHFDYVDIMKKSEYAGIKFILINGSVDYFNDNQIQHNSTELYFKGQEGGFLAGYAAVKNGMKQLGFIGDNPSTSISAYGYGFLQGAEAAAFELGYSNGDVYVSYKYGKNESGSEEYTTAASEMYSDGTEIIFACGESSISGTLSAANNTEKKLITAGYDRRYESPNVILSVADGVKTAVKSALESIYRQNNWNEKFSGKSVCFGSKENGIGIITEDMKDENSESFESRLKLFTKDDYNAVFKRMSDGSITLTDTIFVSDSNGYVTNQELINGLGLVKVYVDVQ